MRTRTVVERIGELMGPIDWSYDFRSHFDNYCSPSETKDAYCERAKALLKQAEELHKAGKLVQVQVNEWWHDLIDIGMYDGWPYWRQTPAILTSGTLGSEWHFFYDLRNVTEKGHQ